MTMQEIRNAILGKRIKHFDTFSGSCQWFTIGYVKNKGTYILVYAEKYKGCGVGIQKKQLPELIQSGEIVKQFELEGCTITETWKLLNA